uniref:glucuronosyltransferase n=1 Tax=Acrobeloides nanus TaxID=290746 RepID=A0A914DH23_9BILA
MNSIQEGATNGVPMIVIPLFGDQFHNAKTLEYRNTSIALERKSLTAEKLTMAIKKIVEDDSYRKNAKRLAKMIAEKPMTAEERVVKYTEFAAKFGPDLNLDLHGSQMSFIEFYCLDIILPPLVIVLAGILYLFYKISFTIYWCSAKLLSVLFSQKKRKHCE